MLPFVTKHIHIIKTSYAPLQNYANRNDTHCQYTYIRPNLAETETNRGIIIYLCVAQAGKYQFTKPKQISNYNVRIINPTFLLC